MSLEEDRIFQQKQGLDFGYHEPPSDHFRPRFNSPFLSVPVLFCSCANVLGLHPSTAAILDEVRGLIARTLDMPQNSSSKETEALKTTAGCGHDRLLELGAGRSSPASEAPATAPERESTRTLTIVARGDSDKPPTPHSLLPNYPSIGSGSSTAPSSSSASVSTPASSTDVSFLPSPDSDATASVPAPDNGECAATPASSPSAGGTAPPPEDTLHTAVLLSSTLYTRAILLRRPFSAVVTEPDAFGVLLATWRIPLARWRSVIGVLLFVLMPILPTVSKSQPRDGGGGGLGAHAGFVKSILQIGFMQMAIEDWEVCCEVMGRVARFGAWLRTGAGGGQR